MPGEPGDRSCCTWRAGVASRVVVLVRSALHLLAELVELTTSGREDGSVQLNGERAVICESTPACLEEVAVVAESIARCIDRVLRLIAACAFGVVSRSRLGVVRQVRDDEIERSRDGVEEVAAKHSDLLSEALLADVGPGQRDGSLIVVGCPDPGRRRAKSDGYCDGTRAGADIRDPKRPRSDPSDRPVDKRFGGRNRCHHHTGRSQDVNSVENNIAAGTSERELGRVDPAL